MSGTDIADTDARILNFTAVDDDMTVASADHELQQEIHSKKRKIQSYHVPDEAFNFSLSGNQSQDPSFDQIPPEVTSRARKLQLDLINGLKDDLLSCSKKQSALNGIRVHMAEKTTPVDLAFKLSVFSNWVKGVDTSLIEAHDRSWNKVIEDCRRDLLTIRYNVMHQDYHDTVVRIRDSYSPQAYEDSLRAMYPDSADDVNFIPFAKSCVSNYKTLYNLTRTEFQYRTEESAPKERNQRGARKSGDTSNIASPSTSADTTTSSSTTPAARVHMVAAASAPNEPATTSTANLSVTNTVLTVDTVTELIRSVALDVLKNGLPQHPRGNGVSHGDNRNSNRNNAQNRAPTPTGRNDNRFPNQRSNYQRNRDSHTAPRGRSQTPNTERRNNRFERSDSRTRREFTSCRDTRTDTDGARGRSNAKDTNGN